MLKKAIIPIIVTTALAIGVISWRAETFSATGLPYSKAADCTEATVNELYLMRKDWNTSLQSLLEQEKAPSEKVKDAFSGMRTYRCWVDYLCEAVLFSANADAKTMTGSMLTSDHINDLPGCVSVDDVEITSVEITSTVIKYIPECQVSKTASNVDTVLKQANDNYSMCRKLADLEFGNPSKEDAEKDVVSKKYIEAFKNQSAAYIGLERALKTSSAAQKGRVLNNKISGILTQMYALEAHVTYMREYLEKFDALLPCYISKCD